MDRSHLVCAQCQWTWPLQSRVGFFEGQALESVACPQCHALALRVVSVRQQSRRFRNQVVIRDVNETPAGEVQALAAREIAS